jgi:hypothetical protein
MKLRALSVSVLAIAALAACNGKAADNSAAPANAIETAAAAPACASGAAALPVTGLCPEQAATLMFAAPGKGPTAPAECSWVIAEAKMPDGAMLYRTAKCPDGTARVEFVPGTPASFEVVESPYPNDMGRWKLIFLLDAPEGKASVLAEARRHIDDEAEAARCQIRAARQDWAVDAFLVDDVRIKPERIHEACADFGTAAGHVNFWRLSQNKGWYFRFGEEDFIVDPESVTLVKRDAAGKWIRS